MQVAGVCVQVLCTVFQDRNTIVLHHCAHARDLHTSSLGLQQFTEQILEHVTNPTLCVVDQVNVPVVILVLLEYLVVDPILRDQILTSCSQGSVPATVLLDEVLVTESCIRGLSYLRDCRVVEEVLQETRHETVVQYQTTIHHRFVFLFVVQQG